MPTYEYQCPRCGFTHEEFYHHPDTSPRYLCKAHAPPVGRKDPCYMLLRRLIGSGGGFLFKGPGFYATDYAKASPKKGASDE
jgi:predicted nucleic acid-binding Zn ribbon protein